MRSERIWQRTLPSFPPSLFSHSPFSFSFYLAHHNPNPSLQSSSSSPPTTTRTTAPAKETGQPRATSEKTQLICTTRLTHYTIAAAAVEAARDLAWGGDFFRGCRVLQAQVRSNCRGNFEQHKPPSSNFGAGPQLFPTRQKLPNNITLLGDMCSWRPPAPAFFPRVGSVGLYFCHRVRRGERNGGREFLGAITLAQPSVVVLFYGFADFHSLSLTQRMLFYFSRLSSLSLSLYYLLSLTLLL